MLSTCSGYGQNKCNSRIKFFPHSVPVAVLGRRVIAAIIWFHSSPRAGKVITYYEEHNDSDCPSPGSRV